MCSRITSQLRTLRKVRTHARTNVLGINHKNTGSEPKHLQKHSAERSNTYVWNEQRIQDERVVLRTLGTGNVYVRQRRCPMLVVQLRAIGRSTRTSIDLNSTSDGCHYNKKDQTHIRCFFIHIDNRNARSSWSYVPMISSTYHSSYCLPCRAYLQVCRPVLIYKRFANEVLLQEHRWT